MDSAPRDGTSILAVDRVGDMFVAFWSYGHWCLTMTGSYAADDMPNDDPVAWMQLPDPPEGIPEIRG